MVALPMARPRPSPSRRGSACSKASKIFSSDSEAMPTPLSLISMTSEFGLGLYERAEIVLQARGIDMHFVTRSIEKQRKFEMSIFDIVADDLQGVPKQFVRIGGA